MENKYRVYEELNQLVDLKECTLVFTNNGSDFHLELVGKVVADDNSRAD